jgi:sugar lactone lactonase YvrE
MIAISSNGDCVHPEGRSLFFAKTTNQFIYRI